MVQIYLFCSLTNREKTDICHELEKFGITMSKSKLEVQLQVLIKRLERNVVDARLVQKFSTVQNGVILCVCVGIAINCPLRSITQPQQEDDLSLLIHRTKHAAQLSKSPLYTNVTLETIDEMISCIRLLRPLTVETWQMYVLYKHM